MLLHQIRELICDDFAAVEERIQDHSQSSLPLIHHLITHLIQSGGKRLRPMIVLLVCHACGYQGKDHITLATLVEFFHTATLLHDDVIDESSLRRGRQTAHEVFGSKASVLVGDYLFVRYMKLMLSIGHIDMMHKLTDMSHDIGYGEIKQLLHQGNLSLSSEDYFDIIRSKTSLLFAVSAEVSALLAHQDERTQKALYQYGLHLGNAFQLTDDMLDYCSSAHVLGKNIGDDLANSKLTMPLLHAYQHGTPHQQSAIEAAFSDASTTDWSTILKILEETQAIQHTKDLAKIEVTQAQEALKILPHNVYTTALRNLADYAITRSH